MAKRLIVPPGTPGGPPVPDRPTFIDLQISAAKFTSLLDNRFRAQAMCTYAEFEWVPDLSHPNEKVTLVVDHIEFQGGSILQPADQPIQVSFTPWSASGKAQPQLLNIKPLQISVPVTLFIKKKKDLLTPGDADVFLTPTIKLLLNLTASGPNFCASYAGIDFAGWIGLFQDDPAVLPAITLLAQSFDICVPFDPGILTFVSGSVTNAALVGSSDLQAVALRFEIGGPNTFEQDWLSFYQSVVPTLLNGQDFSSRLDTDLIRTQVMAGLNGALENNTQVQVTSGIDVWAIPLGDQGLLLISSFDMIVVDGPCAAVGVDVGVTVTISAILHLTQKNLVVAHTVASGSANDWDLFECAFLTPLGAGPLATIMVEVIKAAVLGSLKTTPAGCTQIDKTTFDCSFPLQPKPIQFQPWNLDFGEFTVEAFQGRIDGTCLISGSVDVLSIGLPDLGIDIEPPGFQWDVTGHCGGFQIAASVDVGVGSPDLPAGPGAILCGDPQILNDYLGVFSKALTTTGGPSLPVDLTFTVLLSDLPPNHPYWTYPPYPCVVFFKTSAGAQTISIPPIPQPSSDELNQFKHDLLEKETQCVNQSEPFFGPPAYFNLINLVDPPPDQVVFSEWEATYAGAAAGEALRIQSASGEVSGAGFPVRGVAQIGGWEQAVPGASPSRLVRGETGVPSTAAPSAASVPRRLHVRQQLYIRRSVIGLRGACTHLAVESIDGTLVALCTTLGGLDLYNLSTPLIPDSLDQIDAAGVRGALSWNGRLLVWGHNGIQFLGGRLREHKPVIAAVRSGASVCVLTEAGIELLDGELTVRSKLDLRHTGHLAAAGRFVVVSDETRVRLFDVSDPAQPRDAGHYPLASVSGLQTPVVPNAGNSVLVNQVNQARESLLLVLDSGRPQVAARYPGPPWYAGAVRFRQLLVRLTPHRTQLEVYTASRVGLFSAQSALSA